MAPVDISRQTDLIVHFLFKDDDDDDVQPRMFDSDIEPDTPGSDDSDSFDPVLVADQLRAIGDALNDEARLGAVLTDLKKAAAAAAEEAVEAAFSHGVEALCETHSATAAEVAPEIQLIKASVALGLYVAKTAPELKNTIRIALFSFLTTRVGGWVAQQGGWDKVQALEQ